MKRIYMLVFALFINNANAVGITVYDPTAYMHLLKEAATQARNFKEQMDAVRSQIDEAKRQGKFYQDMVNGHWDVEDVLNDPSVSSYLADSEWMSVLNDVNDIYSLRDEFNLKSDDPATQSRYDSLLKNYAFQERNYKASVSRQKRISKLTDMIKSADTPAKKADLANSLQFESVQLANENQLMESMRQLAEQKQQMEQKAREDKFINETTTLRF